MRPPKTLTARPERLHRDTPRGRTIGLLAALASALVIAPASPAVAAPAHSDTPQPVATGHQATSGTETVLVRSAGTTRSLPVPMSTAPSSPTVHAVALTLDDTPLPAGAWQEVCFVFGQPGDIGAVAATASPDAYGVVLAVTAVTSGWDFFVGRYDYCVTTVNRSTAATTYILYAHGDLKGDSLNLPVGSISPNTTSRYCFHFASHVYDGPVVVSATYDPSGAPATLRTLSTDLEYRSTIGWVYCATILNVGGFDQPASSITLHARAGLQDQSYFNGYVGYLATGQSGRYCFNAPQYSVPVAVVGQATSANAILTTLSTDREDRAGYGYVYCATIRNSSSTGTGVILDGRDGLATW